MTRGMFSDINFPDEEPHDRCVRCRSIIPVGTIACKHCLEMIQRAHQQYEEQTLAATEQRRLERWRRSTNQQGE